jgi:hypothetical protein
VTNAVDKSWQLYRASESHECGLLSSVRGSRRVDSLRFADFFSASNTQLPFITTVMNYAGSDR